MAEIVNLRMVRKAKRREGDQAKAAQNRLLHGQKKGDVTALDMDKARAQRHLDGAMREKD